MTAKGIEKYYRLLYKDKDNNTNRELYIPVMDIIPKIVDFDKSKFLEEIRNEVDEIFGNLKIFNDDCIKLNQSKFLSILEIKKKNTTKLNIDELNKQQGGTKEVVFSPNSIDDIIFGYVDNSNITKIEPSSTKNINQIQSQVLLSRDSTGEYLDLTKNIKTQIEKIYFLNDRRIKDINDIIIKLNEIILDKLKNNKISIKTVNKIFD